MYRIGVEIGMGDWIEWRGKAWTRQIASTRPDGERHSAAGAVRPIPVGKKFEGRDKRIIVERRWGWGWRRVR